VEERFYQQATDLLSGRQKLGEGLLGEITIWNWDSNSKRLLPTKMATETATQLAAAEIAADLDEIRPDLPRNRALHLLTHLEAAKRKVGASRPIDLERFKTEFGGVQAFEVEQVLVEALKLKLIPAATACCELLGAIGAEDLVYSDSHRPRPLVEAILVGDRYLQFAALEAIRKLDPQMPYHGSSYVLSLAVFLAASDGQRAGLVGDNRYDIAQSYAAMMSAEQLQGFSAVTGQELFVQATLNPDIELIILSDSLHRPGYLELIQQLRSDMRTRRLPVALLMRESADHIRLQQLASTDPLFTYLPMSLDREQVGLQIRRVRALTTPWQVELLDRQLHAKVAAEWLQTIASDRNRYRFYDLGSCHNQLAKIVYRPGLAKSGSFILKSLGTPMAQRELLNFVGQSSFSIEDRQAAAAAFAETVRSRGALLTRQEILRQYDRYNASEGESVETQRLLGSILDALEKKSAR
jgi:CheY-like chemotaxis protein